MANNPPVITGFDASDAKTIALGQTVKLDSGALARITDSDSPTISGRLKLTASQGSQFDFFSLDTSDGRISFTPVPQDMMPHDMMTLVLVKGIAVGSYIDHGLGGPSFEIALQNATPEQVEVLLQNMEFTAVNAPPFSILGSRTIDVTLQEAGSNEKATAQTFVNVVDPAAITTSPVVQATGLNLDFVEDGVAAYSVDRDRRFRHRDRCAAMVTGDSDDRDC